MKLRLFLASAIVFMWAGCQCGTSLCDQVKCGTGLECAPSTGKCVVAGTTTGGGTGGGGSTGVGGGTGGGTATTADAGPQCPVSCGGSTPVCDPIAMKCVGCTKAMGCASPTPACDTTSGICYGCVSFVDCEGESMDCDLSTHTCYQFDAGFGGGGGTGGPVQFDDAGLTDHCKDVTSPPQSCKSESCPKGYACANGACVLNGRNGPVQVTLRWNRDEDLDLYVVAPKIDGSGQCEIYYSVPNSPPVVIGGISIPSRGCGAQAYLDRDSNPACKLDHVDVENVVTPTGATPTKGKYTVRANYYQNCSATSPIPYEVEVRANGITRFYCGQFQANQSNGGEGGAGTVITEFEIL